MSSGLTTEIGSAFLSIIMMPLIILNIFSGIVGGIWLAIIGQWKLIGAGLLLSVAMPFFYSIVNLPGIGLGVLAVSAGKKGSKVGFSILAFLASIYNYALLSVWSASVLLFIIQRMESGSFIPYLLWAYSTVMAPLGYMASKEPPDSTGTSMGLFFAEICFIVLAILWIISIPFNSTRLITACLVIVFSLTVTILSVSEMSAYSTIEEKEEY